MTLRAFPLLTLLLLVAVPASAAAADAAPRQQPPPAGPDLEIADARVRHLGELDLLVFEMRLAGTAGGTVPQPAGGLDGAPVLGYVFPTDLEPAAVGFRPVEGTLALAATAHPDFDDTPLWDEDGDGDYDDDGLVFHSHWVVLVPDERVAGGLAVRELPEDEVAAALPPTSPGMPMFLDSPGFSVVLRGDRLRVLVPAARVGGRRDFRFDAVAAYMEVATSGDRPMLGVHRVYQVLSGDLSLPYRVSGE